MEPPEFVKPSSYLGSWELWEAWPRFVNSTPCVQYYAYEAQLMEAKWQRKATVHVNVVSRLCFQQGAEGIARAPPGEKLALKDFRQAR